MWLVKHSIDQYLQNPCCEHLFIKMNNIFLIIVICFLANTKGSPRTKRALPPGYLSVDGTEQCLETERMPGTSSSYLCIPARKPWCCPQGVWNNLSSESLGLVRCQMTNLDPCAEILKNNWWWSMVQNNYWRNWRLKIVESCLMKLCK